jgi:hypothetical protein
MTIRTLLPQCDFILTIGKTCNPGKLNNIVRSIVTSIVTNGLVNFGIAVVELVLNNYHPRVMKANLADIHGWGLLEIRPGRVDHIHIVHLVPCTKSTCKQRPSAPSCQVFTIAIRSAKWIRAEIIGRTYGLS